MLIVYYNVYDILLEVKDYYLIGMTLFWTL